MSLLMGLTILVCMNGVKCWDLNIQGRTNVRAGDTLSLTCNGTGLNTPLMNLDWYKESEKLIPDQRIAISIATKILEAERIVSSTLTIKGVTKEEEGMYKCWISEGIRKSINVKVTGNVNKGEEVGMGIALTPAYFLTLAAFCSRYVM